MKMERIAVSMPHSTAKMFRRYGQVHDMDLCMVAKLAVTKYCRVPVPPEELMDRNMGTKERIFISMPDTAMRLLEFWSENTGIDKQKLMEWAIRKLATEQNISEEEERK